MVKVVIAAYACSPSWGSEQGIGWNWSIEIAKFCEVFVITEGEFRDEIEKALPLLEQRDNIHFIYNNVSDKVRRMCWNQGDWRFYYYYRQWQKKTLEIAKQICKTHHIDIVHQLTMQGFREPGLLWKLKEQKFVWGPVGGFGYMPLSFMKEAPFRVKVFRLIKNVANYLQFKYQPNVQSAFKRADAIIAATNESQTMIERAFHKKVTMLNDTGCDDKVKVALEKNERVDGDTFHIIWVGKFDFRKMLGPALRTIAELKHLNIKFHIVGTGDEAKYKCQADSLNISDICEWHGQVAHEKVNEMMQKADLFFFSSIMEATSTVVMEAIQNHLPIICFDTCGFGSVVNEKIGIKIPLTTPDEAVKNFSKAIKTLYLDRSLLKTMSDNCEEAKKDFTWASKAHTVYQIYQKVLRGKES